MWNFGLDAMLTMRIPGKLNYSNITSTMALVVAVSGVGLSDGDVRAAIREAGYEIAA